MNEYKIKTMRMESIYAFLFYSVVGLIFFSPVILTQRTFIPADLLDQDFLYPPREKKILTLYRWDEVFYSYPTDAFFNREIKRGRIPLWNPYILSGYPVFANGQNAFLNPFKIVLNFLLDSQKAQDLFIFIHLILTGFFTFLYLRILNLSFYPSLFGGIVWSYSGLNIASFSQGSALSVSPYLSLLFLSYEMGVKTGKWKWAGIGGIALALMLLGRHLNLAMLGYGLLIIRVVYLTFERHTTREGRKMLTFFFTISAMGFGISAVQFIPTMELAGFLSKIQRPSESFPFADPKGLLKAFTMTFLHPLLLAGYPGAKEWITIYHLNGFAGIISLLFLLFNFFSSQRRNDGIFFSILYFLLFLTALFTPLTKLAEFTIPWFGRLNPVKLVFPAVFAFTVASALGFQSLLKEKDDLRRLYTLVSGGILLLMLGGIVLWKERMWLSIYVKTPLNPGIVFVLLSLLISTLIFLEPNERTSSISAVSLILIELLPFAYLVNLPVKTSLLNVENTYIHELRKMAGFDRIMGIEPNLSALLMVYSPEGYESLIPDHYFLAIKGEKPPTASLSEREKGKRRLSFEDISYPIARILGVHYLIGTDKVYIIPEEYLEEVEYPHHQIRVLKVKRALPRTFVVGKWKKVKSWKDAVKMVREGYDPSDGILLEEDAGECEGGKGKAKIVEYQPTYVKIEVDIEGCGFLVLSDTWYPGWKVYVDGKENKLYRAYGFLRGVKIAEGKHLVEFLFKPKTFFAGLLVSIPSMLLALFMILRKK